MQFKSLGKLGKTLWAKRITKPIMCTKWGLHPPTEQYKPTHRTFCSLQLVNDTPLQHL